MGKFVSIAIIFFFAFRLSVVADTAWSWQGTSGQGDNWSVSGNWNPSSTPASDASTELDFNLPNSESTNNLSGFTLNSIVFDDQTSSTATQVIFGNSLTLVSNGPAGPSIQQNGIDKASIENALSLGNDLTISGTGSGVLALDGVISGNGGVNVNTSGTVEFATSNGNGLNSYQGGTTIDSGELHVAVDSALGASSGGITFNGGTLAVNSGFSSARAITLNGSGTLDGVSSVNSAIPTFSGAISGNGSLIIEGAESISLSGANTYKGGTTVTNGGTLTIVSDNNLGDAGGSLTLDNGGLATPADYSTSRSMILGSGGGYIYGGSGTTTLSGVISGAGSLNIGGSVDLTNTNSFSGGLAIGEHSVVTVSSDQNLGDSSGQITLGGGTLVTTASFESARSIVVEIVNSPNLDAIAPTANTTLTLTGTISGSIPGQGFLAMTGAGKLVLNGTNTADGTVMKSGTVVAENTGALGSNLEVDGGTADLDGLNFNLKGISGSGGVITDSQATAITLTVGAISYGGTIEDGAGTTTLSVGGSVSDSSQLTGTNTYSGGTIINEGSLSITSDANLGAASQSATFNGGTLKTSGAFSSARNLVLEATGGTVEATGTSQTFSGTISGDGSLTTKGVTILSGNNTYKGGTVVGGGGTLKVSSDSNLGDADGDVTVNGLLETTASFSSDRSYYLNEYDDGFTPDAGTTFTLTNQVTEGNYLRMLGLGTLKITGANNSYGVKVYSGTLILAGVNNSTGQSQVEGGNLLLASSMANSSVYISSGTLGGPGAAIGKVGVVTLPSLALTLGTSTLKLDLAANGASDELNLTGGLSFLGSGTVDLLISDIGGQGLSGTYTLMQWTTDTASLADFSLDAQSSSDVSMADFQISNNSLLYVASVPEPPTGLLCGLGLALALVCRRFVPMNGAKPRSN